MKFGIILIATLGYPLSIIPLVSKGNSMMCESNETSLASCFHLIHYSETPLNPPSPIICAKKSDHTFFSLYDKQLISAFIYRWKEKIKAAFGVEKFLEPLIAEVQAMKSPALSRKIIIKSGTSDQAEIKGFVNFKIKVFAQKKYIKLLLDVGAVYKPHWEWIVWR